MSREGPDLNDRSLEIERQASQWLARRDGTDWSPQDQAAFEAWLGASMRHRVEYLRLQHVWKRTSRMKAVGAGIRSPLPPPPGQWNLSPFFSRREEAAKTARSGSRLRFRALAASLVVAAAVGLAWQLWPPGNTFTTSVGATASVPIQDGSKITLNTDTRVKVSFTETERRIELQQGEAFFEVAKDPDRPFVVAAGDKRVVAVGTKFSVRRDISQAGMGIHVVVTEGAVRVESVNGDAVENIAPQPLPAGTVARANRSGLMVQTRPLPQAGEQLAWRRGVLVFRDVTLAQAAAEFNRYNQQKVVIGDAATAQLRVGGNFRTIDVDAFVRLLEQGYPVQTEERKGEIVVSAR